MKYITIIFLLLTPIYSKYISPEDLDLKIEGNRVFGSIATKVISFGGYDYPKCKLAISLDGRYFFLRKMNSTCIKFTNSRGKKVICNYNKSICKTRDELKRFIYTNRYNPNYSQNNNSMPKIRIRQNMPYYKARRILLNDGWQASYSRWQDIPEYGRVNDYYYKKGWREVEDCSGTGMGYCMFNFHDAYGHKLSVVTAGDEMPVIDNWSIK